MTEITSIYGIFVLDKNKDFLSKTIGYVYDLSSFGFFDKSYIETNFKKLAFEIIDNSNYGLNQDVYNGKYKINSFLNSNNIGIIIISTLEYNNRIIHCLILDILSQLSKNDIDFKIFLKDTIKKYQKPNEIDKISKVSQELDDTINELHIAIKKVIYRGEKLDSLVQKTEELGLVSNNFLYTAKEQNKCCYYI